MESESSEADRATGENASFAARGQARGDNDPSSRASQHESPPVVKVLYLNDHLPNLGLVRGILTHRPHIRLVAAMQGRLGLRLAREQNPGLILLDMNLPDMPGQEVLRHLKEDPRTAAIPVLVVGSADAGANADEFITFGAVAYLSRPLEDVRGFLAVLDKYLQSEPGMPPLTP